MLGHAAVAMWWDIAPQVRAEWEEWHSREHMPERLAIPGFLRGTRWIALSGEPSYFVLYEASTLAVLTGGAYLERLNNPTPWSRKMMPHHLNMVRAVCEVREGWGGGVPQALATIRFSLRTVFQLPRCEGLSGAHLLEAQPMPGAHTAEQQIRGGDRTIDWVLLVGGYDLEAIRDATTGLVPGGIAGFYRPAYSLNAAEIA